VSLTQNDMSVVESDLETLKVNILTTGKNLLYCIWNFSCYAVQVSKISFNHVSSVNCDFMFKE